MLTAMFFAIVVVLLAGGPCLGGVGNGGGGRRSLRSLSLDANANVTAKHTRGATDCGTEAVENFAQAMAGYAFGTCVYGRYCGPGCTGPVDGVEYMASPVDEVDRACYFHDNCSTPGKDTCDNCMCNARLGNWTETIWVRESAELGCGCGVGQTNCPNKLIESWTISKYFGTTCTKTGCQADVEGGDPVHPDPHDVDPCTADYTLYESDLVGGDLYSVSAANWVECCVTCGNDPSCWAWTYKPGMCYLKDATGWTAFDSPGSMSAYYASK